MAYKIPEEIIRLRDETIDKADITSKLKAIAQAELREESKKAKKSLKERWSRLYPSGSDDGNYAQNLTYNDIKDSYKDMVSLYLKNKKNKLKGAEAKENERLNRLINTLREDGVIEDEGGKLKRVNTRRLSDWDTHFNIAEKVYNRSAEGARDGMDLLQDFAEDEGFRIKVSSAHRGKDHRLSKKAASGTRPYTSDHTKGNAIDVSRVRAIGLDGEEKEYNWREFIKKFPQQYRTLVKKMKGKGYSYINEKVGKFNHGHFALKSKQNPKYGKTGQRIEIPPAIPLVKPTYKILWENQEGYDAFPEDKEKDEESRALSLIERLKLL